MCSRAMTKTPTISRRTGVKTAANQFTGNIEGDDMSQRNFALALVLVGAAALSGCGAA